MTPEKLKLAYEYLRRVEPSEDVVQEVMIKLLLKYDSFRGSGNQFYSFMRTVLWNYRIDQNRLKSNLNSFPMSSFDFVGDEGGDKMNRISDLMTSDELSAVDSMIALEDSERLLYQVNKLPAKQALYIKEFYLEGYKIKEIAEKYQDTEEAVRSTMHRGRNKLKKTKI